MEHVLLQHDPAISIDVRISEIDRQSRIIIPEVGPEQQRLNLVQHQLQPGEITGIGVEQAVRSARGSANVAMTVEHDKSVVVLERASRSRRGPGHWNVEGRFHYLFDGPRHRNLGNDFGCHETSVSPRRD